MDNSELVIFVDVDDTLVRTVGTKHIPIVPTIRHIRQLKADGVQLFCWSAGGAEYAKQMASNLGILDCFAAFIPKPHVMIDDQAPGEWKRTLLIHPATCAEHSVATYHAALDPNR